MVVEVVIVVAVEVVIVVAVEVVIVVAVAIVEVVEAVMAAAVDLAPATIVQVAASTADTVSFSSAVTTVTHTLTTTMASITATVLAQHAMCVTLSAFAPHSIGVLLEVSSVALSGLPCAAAVSSSFAFASAKAMVDEATEVLHRAHGPAVGVIAAMVIADTVANNAFIMEMLLSRD